MGTKGKELAELTNVVLPLSLKQKGGPGGAGGTKRKKNGIGRT